MQKIRLALTVGAALAAAASSAEAQGGRVAAIPSAQQIPAGMCQVWIRGVPVHQQPAPTDCATARATAPANSRIIYGSRTTAHQGTVLDPHDPRLDPTNPAYDPRLDPRNSQYDPRYDPRSPHYDPRLDPRHQVPAGHVDRKSQKEAEKAARKHEKESDKELKKEHKGKHGDHDDEDDEDDDRRDRGARRVGCIDTDRDGICDSRQRRSPVLFPRIP